MLLNKVQKRTIDLYETEFSFLYPFPLRWNRQRTRINFSLSGFNLTLFVISNLLNIVYVGMTAYVVLGHYLVRKRSDYFTSTAAIQVLGGLIAFFIADNAYLVWKNPSFIPGLNQTLQWNYHHSSSNNHDRINGKILFSHNIA